MYLPDANSRNIVDAVSRMNVTNDETVMILIGEDSKTDMDMMISNLKEQGICFFGGIFPGLIHGSTKYNEGAVIRKLPVMGKPELVRMQDPDQMEIPGFADLLDRETKKKYTSIILIDGMAPNICLFLSGMLNRLGNSVHYFGGGAGFSDMRTDLCLFTSAGFVGNAAIVALIELESCLGVRHGWKKLIGPLVATRTDRNLIGEFNWENAFDIYRKAVEGDSGRQFNGSNFYEIAKGYPLGLFRKGCEDIGRATVGVNSSGEIICGGEVQTNAVVNILEGKKQSLIRAAQQAAEACRVPGGGKVRHCLVADCISRALLLEDDFPEELDAICRGVLPLDDGDVPEGFLTLGEISSYGEGYLEFLNLTSVVMVMHE